MCEKKIKNGNDVSFRLYILSELLKIWQLVVVAHAKYMLYYYTIMIKCVYPKLIQACFIGQVDDGFSSFSS